jgi:uncharacterized protein (TIRG00374 family)
LVRVGLTAALLAFVFFKVDFQKLAQAFRGIRPWYVVAAYGFYVISLVFKAFRWQRLGVTHRRATVLDCFSATANGFLFGLIGPGTFEFARAYVLKRRAGVPFGSVLGVIVAERALDMVLLLIAVVFMLVLVPGARWLSTVAAIVAGAVALGLGLLALLVSSRRRSAPWLERVLARISPRFSTRVGGFLDSFAEGLNSFKQLRLQGVLAVLTLSVFLWSARAMYALLVFESLGIPAAFGVALFIAATDYLGMFVKLTPAGIGQYEAIAVLVLVAFGIEKSIAAGASIVLHAVPLVVIVSLGLPFLYREHLGMAKLAREKQSIEEKPVLPGRGDPA